MLAVALASDNMATCRWVVGMDIRIYITICLQSIRFLSTLPAHIFLPNHCTSTTEAFTQDTSNDHDIRNSLLRREVEVRRPHRPDMLHHRRDRVVNRSIHNHQPPTVESQHGLYHFGEYHHQTTPLRGFAQQSNRNSLTRSLPGHQIIHSNRLSTLDRAHRPLPQMGQHESKRHSQRAGSRLLARRARSHRQGSRSLFRVSRCG